MSVSASIPATVQIRRGHLLGLIGVVAALAACATAVVIAFAFDTGTSGAVSRSTSVSASKSVPATFTATRKQIEALSTMAPQTGRDSGSVMSMTPAQLAGVGLGTGYQLPGADSSPTAAAVLASMSPETRRYTESIMNLTFEQLGAGAAGQP